MHNDKTLSFYNTLTRSVEPFRPLDPALVRVYCCGPTVYNFQHIGNLRTYIFEDLLMRTLRYAGYQVKHVMNITDVGHLVSDADEGEDKMAIASRREGKTSQDIAAYYTDIFFQHCQMLNISKPDIVCKATEHIEPMQDMISALTEKGYAYQSGGNVYFDVSRFNNYGKLALLDIDTLRAGARIEVDGQKRNPCDFVLWFTKSKFENQELQWDSPWGRGYPGWHIECSAMATTYLGPTIDIHCGGIDHIPVHHTNEIAQSECAHGQQFARFWMHGAFLTTDKSKMSKSSGEFLTLDRIVEKGYEPMAYRYLALGASYRKELSWSWEALETAASSLRRLRANVVALRGVASLPEQESLTLDKQSAETKKEFEDAIFYDLNMPKALAVVHRTLGSDELSPESKLALLTDFDKVLGLGVKSWRQTDIVVPAEILELLKERELARGNKNWSEADRLRDLILEKGYLVVDGKQGATVKPRD